MKGEYSKRELARMTERNMLYKLMNPHLYIQLYENQL